MRGEREVPLHEILARTSSTLPAWSNVEAHRAEVQLATALLRDTAIPRRPRRRTATRRYRATPLSVFRRGAEHRGVHVGDQRAVAAGPVRGGVGGGHGGGDVARRVGRA